MFYHFLVPLATDYSFLNLFQYITFRATYALITSLLICWIFAPAFIRLLLKHHA